MNAPPAAVPPSTDPADPAPKPDVQQATIVAGSILGSIALFLLHLSAAKLSYDTYGSTFWAILDFFFPYIYFPYYVFFLHKPPPPPMFGGRGRRR
jgi:hypothetical protein